jgi:hypothetical protein
MRRDEKHLAIAIATLCFGLGGGLGVALAWSPKDLATARSGRVRLEQASVPGGHCVVSKGADGKLFTEDDVYSGCEKRVLNQYRLVHVGLAGDEGAKDLYGRPIRFIRGERDVLVWSYGEDGIPDTADDQVATFSTSAVRARSR